MSQIFHHSTNTLAKVSIFGGVFIAAATLWVVLEVNRSPYVTRAQEARDQPVPFSHAHHVGGLGVDCRYCHTTVETSSFANIPPTKTCMNCHSLLFADSPYLEPVRESFRSDKSIEWVKVHRLADFVYFDHSIHVNKGVGCSTCHGQVNQMPLVWQASSLQMEWCLACHRQPEQFLRPRDQVFNMDWQAPANQLELGKKLARDYKIRSVELLTSCSTCHR